MISIILMVVVIVLIVLFMITHVTTTVTIDNREVKIAKNLFSGEMKIKIGKDRFVVKNREVIAIKAKRGKYKVKEEW